MQIFKKMYNLYTDAAGETGKNPALLFFCLRDVEYNDISFLNSFFWKDNRNPHNCDSSLKKFSVLKPFLPGCLLHTRHYFVLFTRDSSTNG